MPLRTKPRQTTSSTASPYSTPTTQPTASTHPPSPLSTHTASTGPQPTSTSPSTTSSASPGVSTTTQSPPTSGPRLPCRSSSASGPWATAATRAPSSGLVVCPIGAAATPRRIPTGRTSRRSSWRTTPAAATRPRRAPRFSICTMSAQTAGRTSRSRAVSREQPPVSILLLCRLRPSALSLHILHLLLLPLPLRIPLACRLKQANRIQMNLRAAEMTVTVLRCQAGGRLHPLVP